MNVLHVNASDGIGGASRAAYRIHRCLVDHGPSLDLVSRFRALDQISDDATVVGGMPGRRPPLWHGLHLRYKRFQLTRFQPLNTTLHSLAWPDTGLGHELLEIRRHGVDLLHLHWLGQFCLSVEEIGRLPAPLVWTLHDQWTFCGAEHYIELPDAPLLPGQRDRFSLGYSQASRPDGDRGPDLNRRTWLRKRRSWRHPIHLVCPSRWQADCARRSPLTGQWPITVIPYPIDLQLWRPVARDLARNLLELPQDRLLVLFGATGGMADGRKGGDLLLQALRLLAPQWAATGLAPLECLVFGQRQPPDPPVLPFSIRYLGTYQDDLSLRLIYSAADVMVVPSRLEVFGQTASEAQACGIPVVAFRTGGLADIVEDGRTGALADPLDVQHLASRLFWVLADESRRLQLAKAARQRAVERWNPQLIASSYRQVYDEALQTSRSPLRLG